MISVVIAQQVKEAMLRHHTRLDTENAEKKSEPIRRMSRFVRDLQKQVHTPIAQHPETRFELRLSPENTAQVVQVGPSPAEQHAESDYL